jgi:uncharacterized protein (UPF0248 family)
MGVIKNNPRYILNKFKWQDSIDIIDVKIWYVHRGNKNNTKIISGDKIVKLSKTFMETKSATIPYHRIFKIYYKDKIIFERNKKKLKFL